MIELTKLSNEPIWLNPHLMRSLESSPDSIVCMTDGTRIPVRQSVQEINQKLISFWRSLQPLPIVATRSTPESPL